MKKISLLILPFILFSCKKTNDTTHPVQTDRAKTIDSINIARTKYNDSIKILNSKNHFRDLSGTHQLEHSSIGKSGEIQLKNVGRDLYEISGGAKSGKNYIKIEGELKMVSEEFIRKMIMEN